MYCLLILRFKLLPGDILLFEHPGKKKTHLKSKRPRVLCDCHYFFLDVTLQCHLTSLCLLARKENTYFNKRTSKNSIGVLKDA